MKQNLVPTLVRLLLQTAMQRPNAKFIPALKVNSHSVSRQIHSNRARLSHTLRQTIVSQNQAMNIPAPVTVISAKEAQPSKSKPVSRPSGRQTPGRMQPRGNIHLTIQGSKEMQHLVRGHRKDNTAARKTNNPVNRLHHNSLKLRGIVFRQRPHVPAKERVHTVLRPDHHHHLLLEAVTQLLQGHLPLVPLREEVIQHHPAHHHQVHLQAEVLHQEAAGHHRVAVAGNLKEEIQILN
jgi:hypothetical protein